MSKEQFRELAKKLYRVERELRRFEGTSDTQTFRLPAKTWRLSGLLVIEQATVESTLENT